MEKASLFDKNWQNRSEVLKALLDALPKERMIQVRIPQMKQRYVYGANAGTNAGALTDAEAFTGTDKARIAFIMTVFYHHRMITALTMITAIHHHQVNLRQLSLEYIRWMTVNMFPLAAKLVMTPTVPRIIAKVQVMLKQKCEACIIAF